jgi:hypothetical protein
MSDLDDRIRTDAPTEPEIDDIDRRDEFLRQFEGVVASAWDWARADDSDEAHDIARALEDIYDRFASATEDEDADREGA